MPTQYNARAETTTPLDAAGAQLLDALVDYFPAVGRSEFARTEVIITLPAESLRQAATTALAVLTAAVTPFHLVSFEVLETVDFDRRTDLAPIPDLLSVSEVAEELDITRQAVLARIDAGTLPATRIGNAWAVPKVSIDPAAFRSIAEAAAKLSSVRVDPAVVRAIADSLPRLTADQMAAVKSVTESWSMSKPIDPEVLAELQHVNTARKKKSTKKA